jgi:alkylated DNA repair dioxygenase AlkB
MEGINRIKIDNNLKVLIEQAVVEVDEKLETDPKFKMFNRECTQHRNVGFFSDVVTTYKYSGRDHRAKPMTFMLQAILSQVNLLLGSDFNSILINKYKDGNDYISAHSDDEKTIDQRHGVISISSGSSRIFRIRDKVTKQIVADIPTRSDEILQMCASLPDGRSFQKTYTHEVPANKAITEPRYSLTFRKFNI